MRQGNRHQRQTRARPRRGTACRTPGRKHRRRGHSALEYLFLASLISVAIIAGAQRIGLLTTDLMDPAATALEDANNGNPP